MNRNELIGVLRKDLESNDFSNITSEISYEVRKEFFEEKKLVNTKGDNVFYLLGFRGILQNLFTNEEAKKLLNQYQDFANRSIIFLNLSDEEKIKYIDEVLENDGYVYDEKNKFSFLDVILSIKRQEMLDQVILNLINKQNLDRYDYRRILKSVSPNLKKIVFDKMVELHNNGKENIIFEYYIKDILNELPSEERKNAIFQMLNLTDHNEKNENGKRSGLIRYSIDELIETIPKEDQLEVLKEIKKYMEETGIKFASRYLLLNISLENFKEACKMFINDDDNNKILISFDIEAFAKKNSHLEQYIDIYIELQEETGKTLIDEYSFTVLLEKFSEEIQEKIFINYVFNKKVFDFEKTIIHMSPLIKYKIIDQVILIYLGQGYSLDQIHSFIDDRIINRNEYVGYPDGINLYSNINSMYIKKYNLNPNNFNMFIKKFGYCVTKFLDNQNIIKALKMDENEFLKYLEIFNENNIKLNNDDVNTVCNALFQREFRLQQSDDYNIFSRLESLLDSKEIESKKQFIQLFKEICQYVNISDYTSDTLEDFIIKLYSNNKESINILHEITNHYIAQKRDIYCKKKLTNIEEELYLKRKISKQYYKKKYIEKFNYSNFKGDIKFSLHNVKLTEEQLSLFDNSILLKKIFDFKRNPNEVNLDLDEKKYLKVFESMLNLLYEHQINSIELESEDTVYEYEPFETKSESLLGIMVNIDPDVLKLNILSNNAVYQELLNTINKYHLLGWNKTFNPVFPLSDIIFDDGTIAGMICYFNEILPKLDKGNTSLTKIIDYGNVYDATSQVYKSLLGKEDYSLIAANEGLNKASMPKYKRLQQVPQLVKKMYERKYVTIPPMDKNIQLSNQKKLNVVIGNSTNTMNLTYGERTNACLRIGGAFNDLFRYCIEDQNGFHIRFTNPSTNKFVSRVSGIRNGNTVFLNELRESEDDGYTNEDLIEAINIVASELIEKSKNSSMPIDNIIITSDYALKEHEQEEQALNIGNRSIALRGLSFNIKENSTGIVLKTSNSDNSLVPYHFTEDVPTYDVQREKIKLYTSEEADNKVIQMYMINELLSGKDIDEISTELSTHYQYCICSSDWFIAVDKDNQIIKYIMPNTSNKEKANEELQNTLLELEKNNNISMIDNIIEGGYKR